MRRLVCIFVVVAFVGAATQAVQAESAGTAAFTAGQALLAQGDFDGALKEFKTAARKDRDNEQYAQEYALLRQVLKLRQACAKEQDPAAWEQYAGALRSYYYDHGLYLEALPLDVQRFGRVLSAESAALLAETQLKLGQNDEAAKLLGGLSAELVSARTQVLQALAQVRLGNPNEARKLVQASPDATEAEGAGHYYDLARLQMLLGDKAAALAALTRTFELTPPSQLDALKARIGTCGDFAAVASSAEFAQVLATESKVTESKCSSGSSCGKCPNRSKCGGTDKKKP